MAIQVRSRLSPRTYRGRGARIENRYTVCGRTHPDYPAVRIGTKTEVVARAIQAILKERPMPTGEERVAISKWTDALLRLEGRLVRERDRLETGTDEWKEADLAIVRAAKEAQFGFFGMATCPHCGAEQEHWAHWA